jgi:starch phosphorylase
MKEILEWFKSFQQSSVHTILTEKPLAYFCAEFALSDTLPLYAGGLGILAGDYVRELADQQIPAVAVSLCYRDRSPGKKINENDEIFNTEVTPQSVGLDPVVDPQDQPIIIKIPILDKEISVRAWKWQHKSIPVYLLDTDCPENLPENRHITHRLYNENKETRLKQEIILGIGGHRLLEALQISPSIFHMNEGHSAMLALEIIRHEMKKRKVSFQEALKLSLHHVIFTNHTLVAAGNETYSRELVTLLLSRYASELELPVVDLFNLGVVQESNTFSMSLFALRLAGRSNAVSVLHGQYAEKTWPEYKIEAITNGIHIPTWNHISNSLPESHQQNKKQLLEFIKQQTGKVWPENALVLGWARRMVRYKRPLALFGEIEQLKQIVGSTEKPVRIIISGSAHPADDEGVQILKTLQDILQKSFSETIVYLPNYKKELAEKLVTGVDVWLNTPVVGSEACGTSGMKAGLNGALPASTKDGWIYEIDLSQMGWELQNDSIHENIISVISNQIIPEFFQDQTQWQNRMQKMRQTIIEQYSTTRMLKDYLEKMYIPIITSSQEHYFSA